MSLSGQEVERYVRQIVLRGVGGPGQNKLKAARALVVGAGQYLGGAGGRIFWIVDDDVIDLNGRQAAR